MRIQKVVTVFFLISLATQSFADCNNKRPANENDLKNGKAALLIKGLSSACANNLPTEFFSQQTVSIKQALLKKSNFEQKEYVNLLCRQLKPSFNNSEAIVYSIEPSRSKECGQPKSKLLGKNHNGELILRMTISVEDNKLKLDEF